MKDIYIIMNMQNILNTRSYGLDLSLDFSEFYDFELSKGENIYQIPFTGVTSIFDSECLTGFTTPWSVEIEQRYTGGTCDFTIQRRNPKGWSLDFVFNRQDIDWSGGTTFYYWGISGETNQRNFADNNLSFSFTDDGRIKWEAYRYSGICDTISGYSETFYISSGQTPVLCQSGTSEDFHIAITFDRYRYFENCEIPNEGGINDLIISPYPISSTGGTNSTTTQIMTGYSITNTYDEWMSGDTLTTEYIQLLNKKWANERKKRLGVLKIYLNGRPIYKLKDWEEVIPSERESENPLVQIYGGGSIGYVNIHTGQTQFDLLNFKYHNEPKNFISINYDYKNNIKPNYTIVECNGDCDETVIVYLPYALLYADEDFMLTQNEDIIIY